ncbi:MAG TPA: helix-turn-helix transcriptional regulator [Ktedonobacteraceae bacterium]|nr:helix-turn-helix transcriptional regulator [Ktedonobacteraceae bacterium]
MEEEKRYWVDKDGNIYGPFSTQDDGFPCAGEVIQFYRKQQEMSVKDLAQVLKVSPRRVQMMEKNYKVPDSMERRKFLAKTLDIPPILLGLASIDAFLRPADVLGTKGTAFTSSTRMFVDQKAIAQYQSQLKLFWSLHYTSSANSVQSEIQAHILQISALLSHRNGGEQEQLTEQLCGFYELASRVESDGNNAEGALSYLNMAIELAQPLGNTELFGRLLYKRGLVFYEARRFSEALADLEQANILVPQLTSPLAGSILLELGLVKSYLAESGSLTDTRIALKYFDRAEKYTRLSQTDGGMGIRYDSGRYLTAKGEGLLVLRKFTSAEEALDLAQEYTSPDLTRRQLFIDLQRVKWYTQQKEYPTASALARESVNKARGIGSLYSVKSLQEITKPLFGSHYGKSDDAEELQLMMQRAKRKLS